MKKIFLFVLTTIIIFSLTASVFAASFKDVPADAYYAGAADRMAAAGILGGVGDGNFEGDKSITRAQMAVVAVRLLDKETEAKAMAGETEFTDVLDVHAWATGYINCAVKEGIIIGDGDGKFRPDDLVKYEEAVKIIVCALGLDEGVKIDSADWSKEYIEAAEKEELLGGLIGKKGEAMLRSDIAVICDKAVVVREAAEETSAETTKKPSKPYTPSAGTTAESTTATVAPEATAEPEVTTEATTVATTEPTGDILGPLELPPLPID